ncbi:PSMD9 [Symbiodinium natans]|uniref:PSMD9 protein n=1 Tax=Symbiodinium natans TaxID=878477 RepID=A0A812UCA4_9DINO|nr:PSMD9 [Symbiodinium natans]
MDPAAMEEFRKLDQEKNRLEAEIKTLYEYLTEDGMPGISGPLVDDEGFPRGDIDLYAVRQARNKYVCAQTDHIEVMKKIEQAITALHAGAKVHVPRSAPAAPTEGPPEDEPMGENQNVLVQVKLAAPFAEIDEVSAGSPAEAAGLRVGDLVCRFGTVNLQDTGDLNACFNAIRDLVPRSAGTTIPVTVLRGESPARVELQLTPQQWAGRGLLGCHMNPKP